jgi:hypothetical protein
MDDAVFVLSLPRSFSSLVSTMIGQHPQLYGLPETHLLTEETVAAFLRRCQLETFDMADGVLRAIAELGFHGQSDDEIAKARGWLRRRQTWSTGMVFETIAHWAAPRLLVDKSPTMCYDDDYLTRAAQMFPRARFLHLVRHPRAYADSVLRMMADIDTYGPTPKWLRVLASSPYVPKFPPGTSEFGPYDPQAGWLVLNERLVSFLDGLPADRSLFVRGEDVLADPVTALTGVARWLGLRTDADAIDQMTHPERSPYACYGPKTARHGNDLAFLDHPSFTARPVVPVGLPGPLPWRADGGTFSPEVVALARRFGYA